MTNLKVVSNNPEVERTERDVEIVRLAGEGKTQSQIAQQFGLSRSRVASIIEVAKRKADRAAYLKEICALPREEGLDLPIHAWDLSGRIVNCFKNENINTLREALEHTEAELLRLPHLGRNSLDELKALLAGRGFKLGQFYEAGQARREIRKLQNEVKVSNTTLLRVQQEKRYEPLVSSLSRSFFQASESLRLDLASLKSSATDEFRRMAKWHDQMIPFINDINTRLTALEQLVIKSLGKKE